MNKNKTIEKKYILWLNMVELLGIAVLLLLAFALQFWLKELPCPLCLLQRVGFLITAMGLLLNIRYGVSPKHYSLTLLGALFTGFVSLRQVALHVLPGSGSYGSSIFGLHLYTWSFIISMLIIIYTSVILSIDIQYLKSERKPRTFSFYAAFICLLLISGGNLAAVIAECGLQECPDNPITYKL